MPVLEERQFTWTKAQKELVLEKIQGLEAATGAKVYNPNGGKYGMLVFHNSGLKAGGVTLKIERAIMISSIVSEYLTRHFNLQDNLRPSLNLATGNYYSMLFFPLGGFEWRITTQEDENILLEYVKNRINPANSEHHNFRLDIASLSELLRILERADRLKIIISDAHAASIIRGFNEWFAPQVERVIREYNRRVIYFNRRVFTEGGTQWLIEGRPENYRASDKTVRSLTTEDPIEAYRFIRDIQFRYPDSYLRPGSPFDTLATTLLDMLLSIPNPNNQAQEEDKPNVNFLND